MISYLILAPIFLLSIAIAGIVSDKHFVVVLLGVELVFIASLILLGYFFSSAAGPNPSGVALFISIWTVASAEVITLIAFYIYMKANGISFDISKLSKLKG